MHLRPKFSRREGECKQHKRPTSSLSWAFRPCCFRVARAYFAGGAILSVFGCLAMIRCLILS